MLQIKNVTKIRSIAEAVFKNVKTDFSAGELLWMGMQAMQIDNSSIQFFTLPGYGKMSTAGTSVQYSFFFPYYDQTLELVNKYFNPYEEPISKLDIVGGPDTTTYSGGYVSSGEEDNVWGDTSGSYDYSEDYYEEPDYSYDEHPTTTAARTAIIRITMTTRAATAAETIPAATPVRRAAATPPAAITPTAAERTAVLPPRRRWRNIRSRGIIKAIYHNRQKGKPFSAAQKEFIL